MLRVIGVMCSHMHLGFFILLSLYIYDMDVCVIRMCMCDMNVCAGVHIYVDMCGRQRALSYPSYCFPAYPSETGSHLLLGLESGGQTANPCNLPVSPSTDLGLQVRICPYQAFHTGPGI